MEITSVNVTELVPTEQSFKYTEDMRAGNIVMLLLRIGGEDGNEGHCMTWLATPGAFQDTLARLRSTLVGRDVHDIEAVSTELTSGLQAPNAVASAVDIALWDLLGKHHEQPVYKLLTAARHEVRAYASTIYYPTVQEYVDLALACRDEGFTAYKIHPFGKPDKDIELCRAVREAVGDTMDLMLDPVNAYDRIGAFKVGRALEELDFYWYEAPIPDTDIQGLTDLTRSLDISITAVESVSGGLLHYPQYLTTHVVDSIRSVGDWIGGITAMRKAAALCEAFGVKYEPHSYGTTLIQAAHFHVMLAINNCDLVELPVPTGILDAGMKNGLRVDKNGNVPAPTLPGLGYQIDEDEIDRLTARQIDVPQSVTFTAHM
jgi:L-alanine-DL-glutamate epimerase-like enolase superfamily enzyme